MDVSEVNEDVWSMALACFDGDQNKAFNLLKLLRYIPTEVEMPDVSMVLPEDE